MHGAKQMRSQCWERKWTQAPISNPKAISVNHSQRKLSFLQGAWLSVQTILRGGPGPAVNGQHKANSMIFFEMFCLMWLFFLDFKFFLLVFYLSVMVSDLVFKGFVFVHVCMSVYVLPFLNPMFVCFVFL